MLELEINKAFFKNHDLATWLDWKLVTDLFKGHYIRTCFRENSVGLHGKNEKVLFKKKKNKKENKKKNKNKKQARPDNDAS